MFVNYKRQAFIEWDYRIAENEDRWSQSVVSTLLIHNDYYLGWLPDNFGNSLNGKWVSEPVGMITREETLKLNYYEVFV